MFFANSDYGFRLEQFKQKVSVLDKFGKPALTATDGSNPWWALLEEAVKKANGKLSKMEIFPASTDARYFRLRGLPAIGFSPMANTPILLHDHNEVNISFTLCANSLAGFFYRYVYLMCPAYSWSL